ncbi:MAG: hypothetical protein R3B09_17505 [Nannocystaceae bacterium]
MLAHLRTVADRDLTISVWPATRLRPPRLAYAALQSALPDGSWTPALRGCCDETVVDLELPRGDALETVFVVGSAWELRERSTARVVGKHGLLSEAFVVDARASDRDGAFERAYAEGNARFVAALRGRGLDGSLTREADPAAALVARLIGLRSLEAADAEAQPPPPSPGAPLEQYSPDGLARAALTALRLEGHARFASGWETKSTYKPDTLDLDLEVLDREALLHLEVRPFLHGNRVGFTMVTASGSMVAWIRPYAELRTVDDPRIPAMKARLRRALIEPLVGAD